MTRTKFPATLVPQKQGQIWILNVGFFSPFKHLTWLVARESFIIFSHRIEMYRLGLSRPTKRRSGKQGSNFLGGRKDSDSSVWQW
jgi:hypothetical protein